MHEVFVVNLTEKAKGACLVESSGNEIKLDLGGAAMHNNPRSPFGSQSKSRP